MVAAERQAITSRGYRIAYTDEGDGPAIVLLHGFLGYKELWLPFSQFLRERGGFRVVCIDMLAHGKSDAPVDVTAYSLQQVAECVTCVLDNARLAGRPRRQALVRRARVRRNES